MGEKLFAVAYLAGVVWLLAWEFVAIGTRHMQWTISDMTWTLEGTGWTFARYLIAVGLIGLSFHLSFGWFR